eukprot:CAMPEP_0194047302 /NCGR_PEP_ID=MMETSP0009_2-20130614/23869_1 /TAXON_ID=210454 /ORGANISM="Grammatophora oceanica, Strain CCMP 410" /LENGTH=486 /DNA_ID=CAMNT_0038692859 /DNA_START=71 /DNA_END=1531 /DNA_ORIENTATION=+
MSVTVLYRVVNHESDQKDPLYNAFQLPRGPSVTLASVKKHCRALHSLNHLGPEGYHWRVCVEEKPVPGGSTAKGAFSWWDVQDENARLPVKESSMSELGAMFMPSTGSSSGGESSSSDSMTKATKGALKGLGKAMKAVSDAVDGGTHHDTGPRVPVIAFKLLDLVKMHDDFALKHGGQSAHHGGGTSAPAPRPAARAPAPRTPAPAQRAPPRAAPRTAPPAHRHQSAPAARARARAPVATSNLMDFGEAPKPAGGHHLHHAASMPSTFGGNPNETRAEKLKREYAQKKSKANRVWDDVDQRWVEVDPKAAMKAGSTSAPPGASSTVPAKKKAVGIAIDARNAAGKSAAVQAGVGKRVEDLRKSQADALNEVRAREQKKKLMDAEEDAVRLRLDPKIKAWSEEHGKKKQLRALLASLHTILWPGAKWKQISIGDILDDGKVKKCFHKASRVVHPDKTGDLDAEKRFLAKRIFDALSQAKTEFDNGAR